MLDQIVAQNAVTFKVAELTAEELFRLEGQLIDENSLRAENRLVNHLWHAYGGGALQIPVEKCTRMTLGEFIAHPERRIYQPLQGKDWVNIVCDRAEESLNALEAREIAEELVQQ